MDPAARVGSLIFSFNLEQVLLIGERASKRPVPLAACKKFKKENAANMHKTLIKSCNLPVSRDHRHFRL